MVFDKTFLKAVPELIEKHDQYAIEARFDQDMVELYESDRDDFMSCLSMFRNRQIPALRKFIDEMDTGPRDGIVLAFASDLGADWVRDNLGWNV